MSEISELAGDLTGLADQLPLIIRRELTTTALRAEAGAKQLTTTRLRVRSGSLRNSIQSQVEADGDSVRATIQAGSELAYARIQEEGGTITPVMGRFLAIPVGPALTGAGVAKTSPRQVPGLHFEPRGPRLADDQGRTWFLLKTSVTLKPKRFLADAVDAALEQLPEQLGQAVDALVGG